MLNAKRQGFTLMEIVLVMVLIAILATGVAIGFTSYINRGHETGITTDYNSTFQNPVRMSAIEKGRLPRMSDLKSTVIADGFVAYTGTDWQTAITESLADDLKSNAAGAKFGVEKGNKRYEVSLTTFDETTKTIGGTGAASAIMVRADHSSKETTAIYVLNSAKNDVVTYVGTVDGDELVID